MSVLRWRAHTYHDRQRIHQISQHKDQVFGLSGGADNRRDPTFARMDAREVHSRMEPPLHRIALPSREEHGMVMALRRESVGTALGMAAGRHVTAH